MILGIDFDGTVVLHAYPEIGDEVPEAFYWLKRFQEAGAQLILWTMRSDDHDEGFTPLAQAIAYCRERGIEFWGVNRNPDQHTWSASPKVYAHRYIDDAAFGCPLVVPAKGRPYADWSVIGPAVMKLLEQAKGA